MGNKAYKSVRTQSNHVGRYCDNEITLLYTHACLLGFVTVAYVNLAAGNRSYLDDGPDDQRPTGAYLLIAVCSLMEHTAM